MKNKFLLYIIPMILAPFLVAFFIINAVQFFKLGIYHLTFNYHLLFIDGNNEIFSMYLKLIALFEAYLLLYFWFSLKGKTYNNASINKKDYSYLSSKNQAKKGLTRIEFTKNLEITTNTLRYKLDFYFDGIKRFINMILRFFNVSIENQFNTLSYFTDLKLPYRAGIPIITTPNAVWVDANKNHSLIIGTTNSGKSYSIIYIALILCVLAKENIVVNDIKGELYDMMYPILKKHGYKIRAINFINPKQGNYYNPLSLAIKYYRDEYLEYKLALLNHRQNIADLLDLLIKYQETKQEVIYDLYYLLNKLPEISFSKSKEAIIDIAQRISSESKNNNDSFWNDTAGDLIAGLIILMLEEHSVINGQKVFLKDELINFKSISILVNLAKPISDNKPPLLNLYIQKNRKETDDSYLKLKTILDSPKNTLGSILSVVNRVLQKLIISDDIISMMSKNDIDFTKLDDELTAIFIIIHDEKNTYHNLTSIIIQQIYEVLISLARKNPKNSLKIPMNIQWDEFANGAAWKNITNALTAARSRDIRFNLVVQDFGQIESLYGKDATTIKANVMNIIFLLTSDNNTKEEISKMVDTTSYFDKKQNKVIEKRLISTSRLSKLQLGEAVIIRQRRNPYIAKYTPFDKYNFYKHFKKLKNNPEFKKPYRDKMDKASYINLATGESNINEIFHTRN